MVHDYSRFNAKESLEVLSRCQVNTLCAPPTVWRMLILENLGQKPPHLRELVGAGEPLNPEIIDVVESAWNLQIRDGFGQTETTAQIGNSPGQKVKLGSMGRPLPGYVPVLLNEKEEEVLEGEIALKPMPERPLGLMQGYLDDPERTAKVMAHGYYRVLLEHDAVAEAAIIPSPDDLRLYVPKAIVVLKPGFAPHAELAQQILDFCKEKLAPYKRIRRLEFAELPKTISGKIRRVQLRAIENERIKNKQRGPQEYWRNER